MSFEINYEVDGGIVDIKISDYQLLHCIFESESHVFTPNVIKALRDAETVVEENLLADIIHRYSDVTFTAVEGNTTLTHRWAATENTVWVSCSLGRGYSGDSVNITLNIDNDFDADIDSYIEQWVESESELIDYLDDCHREAMNAAYESIYEDSITVYYDDDLSPIEIVESVTEQCKMFGVTYIPTAVELNDVEQLQYFFDGYWVVADHHNHYIVGDDRDNILERLEWAVENTCMLTPVGSRSTGGYKITEQRLVVAETDEEVARGNGYIYFELAAVIEADDYTSAA